MSRGEELLKGGFTPALWAEVRKECLAGRLDIYEWRRLWRGYHPNGQRNV